MHTVTRKLSVSLRCRFRAPLQENFPVTNQLVKEIDFATDAYELDDEQIKFITDSV
jgi:hypothetical protein